RDDREFLLAGQVVADVTVVDLGWANLVRVLDEQGDSDGIPAAAAEDLAAFAAREFARGALVPAQVEDVDRGELSREALAEAVGGVAVNEPAIADKADDPLVLDTVAGPAERPDVRVVQGVLVSGC